MITILGLAEELRTSKSTINRKIKELGLKSALEFSDGKYYLTDEQADTIRRTMKRTTADSEAKHDPGQITHHDAERSAPRRTNSSASQDAQLIKDLMQQLKEKDAQIKQLHGIIEQNQTIIDQQQKLNLISQQRILALEDQQQKQAQPQGLFARLFGKNRQQAQPQAQEATKEASQEQAEEKQS